MSPSVREQPPMEQPSQLYPSKTEPSIESSLTPSMLGMDSSKTQLGDPNAVSVLPSAPKTGYTRIAPKIKAGPSKSVRSPSMRYREKEPSETLIHEPSKWVSEPSIGRDASVRELRELYPKVKSPFDKVSSPKTAPSKVVSPAPKEITITKTPTATVRQAVRLLSTVLKPEQLPRAHAPIQIIFRPTIFVIQNNQIFAPANAKKSAGAQTGEQMSRHYQEVFVYPNNIDMRNFVVRNNPN